MSALFNLSNIQDPIFYQARAAMLPPEEEKLEELLNRKYTWYPYRLLPSHLEKTHEFVRAYDRAACSLVMKNAEIPEPLRQRMRNRRHFVHPDTLLAPWIRLEKGRIIENPDFKGFVEARRAADKRGMIYEDYCYGAIISAMKRGWPDFPRPKQLASDKLLGKVDKFYDATIPGYEAQLYKDRIKTTDHQFFTAKAFTNHPLQWAYFRHIALELMRIYQAEQRSLRAWKGYQRDGRIPTCLDFRMLLHSVSV